MTDCEERRLPTDRRESGSCHAPPEIQPLRLQRAKQSLGVHPVHLRSSVTLFVWDEAKLGCLLRVRSPSFSTAELSALACMTQVRRGGLVLHSDSLLGEVAFHEVVVVGVDRLHDLPLPEQGAQTFREDSQQRSRSQPPHGTRPFSVVCGDRHTSDDEPDRGQSESSCGAMKYPYI